jgi:hypothetical protein
MRPAPGSYAGDSPFAAEGRRPATSDPTSTGREVQGSAPRRRPWVRGNSTWE